MGSIYMTYAGYQTGSDHGIWRHHRDHHISLLQLQAITHLMFNPQGFTKPAPDAAAPEPFCSPLTNTRPKVTDKTPQMIACHHKIADPCNGITILCGLKNLITAACPTQQSLKSFFFFWNISMVNATVLTPYFLIYVTDVGTCRRFLFMVTYSDSDGARNRIHKSWLSVSCLLCHLSLGSLCHSLLPWHMLSQCYSSAARDFAVV